MRIIGIDPGYAIVGYGAVSYENNHFQVLEYGAITTPASMPFPDRIALIYDELDIILRRMRPDAVSMEKLFFNSNTKTAIDVSQARGVLMLAVKKFGAPLFEYTPLQVKQAVVGYGRAEKQQVMEMTRLLLKLENMPKYDDTSDALAIAICHAHCAGSLLIR